MVRLFSNVYVVLALVAAVPAVAQIKPASSGALSYREPEMRKHGSGLYRPRAVHHWHGPISRAPSLRTGTGSAPRG